MKDIQFILWLLPILFMFHDFEEIIFMKPWIRKNKKRLVKKYPKLSEKIMTNYDSLTTSSFALGVAEEFMLISIITITAFLTGWYFLWFGAFIAFTIHLIVHCIQWIAFKGYVPVIVTSIICLPICCYFIVLFLHLYKADIEQIVLFSVVGVVVTVVNLLAVHKAMFVFDKWLIKYENNLES